jgi:CRISPR-associated protein Cas2
MYLILVYDVASERVGKVCKTLRRRLTWVQNSVFEGEVSEADFKKIEFDLQKIINPGRDSVLFYCIDNPRGWEKRVLGHERATTNTFL